MDMELEKEIREALKSVIDPELMLNIVDLGLVYGVRADEDEKTIDIAMTLTSPGCPLGDVILNTAQQILQEKYPGYRTEIQLVWDPPWSMEHLTDYGKKFLGRN